MHNTYKKVLISLYNQIVRKKIIIFVFYASLYRYSCDLRVERTVLGAKQRVIIIGRQYSVLEKVFMIVWLWNSFRETYSKWFSSAEKRIQIFIFEFHLFERFCETATVIRPCVIVTFLHSQLISYLYRFVIVYNPQRIDFERARPCAKQNANLDAYFCALSEKPFWREKTLKQKTSITYPAVCRKCGILMDNDYDGQYR